MSDVINVKDALDRVQDDKELLLELFDIFSEDFPQKRDLFWKALKENDVVVFQQVAHGLKGATGNISAAQMHENCINLDKMGKDRDLKTAQAALELLDRQFEAFKVEAARLKKEFAK